MRIEFTNNLGGSGAKEIYIILLGPRPVTNSTVGVSATQFT
jgi:hypothetical protein